MKQPLVDRITQAVLYEGYLLYPYRASAVKNRQRFNFGAIVPRDYSEAHSGNESWTMQTECLLRGPAPSVRIRARFLHLLQRQVEQFVAANPFSPSMLGRPTRPVDFLEVDQQRYQTWQEAIERQVDSLDLIIQDLCGATREILFKFGPSTTTETICGIDQKQAGLVVRTQQELWGTVAVKATRLADDLHRLRVTIRNETPLPDADSLTREQALLSSFASTHAVLTATEGQFSSLLDPEPELVQEAAECQQHGCWPVLVGENDDRGTMLASPIILYDYPQIAEESPGDFFDATEIDEMLMLRIMTMTPEEQREMRSVDEQARRLLERTESLPEDYLETLHGAMRGMGSINESQMAAEEKGVTLK